MGNLHETIMSVINNEMLEKPVKEVDYKWREIKLRYLVAETMRELEKHGFKSTTIALEDTILWKDLSKLVGFRSSKVNARS